ncbi:MAG: filamentous hemagglutinin N-terminal domain-containing protein [Gammaproteobacteria bacterium]
MSTRNSSGKHNGAAVPRTALSALSLALLSVHALAQDLPTGEVVRHGDATFTRTDNSLTIDQRTGKLVVNWNDFSVGAGNLVDFRQNPTDIALNRVVGDNPSYIFGDIRAGGQVFLVNQAGILFSPTARVDAAGLVASTLGISDEDFLAGNYRFSGAGGSVVNKGRINVTDGGYVALLGQEAINEGIITARLGAIGLGAGDRMTLDIVGDGLVNLQVDKATVDALVENRGIIIAPGGVVLMTASAMNQLAATVVNNTGVIEATSLAERDGKVFLVAEGGNVSHTGSIDVSGEGAANGGSVLLDSDATTLVGGEILAASGNIGGLGGDVQVLGAQVALATGSEIIASGVAGGGTVLVGGDFQGTNADVRNAENTFVATGARIEADALAEGDGGQVIVWADDSTRFFGSISATGGSAGGNGGFAEVSGKQTLGFYGDVDLRAALGLKGQLLLDPQILRIIDGAAGAAGLDGTLDPGGLINFLDTDGVLDTLSVGQIEATSLSADITLNAGQVDFLNSANITLAADSSLSLLVNSVLAGGGSDAISNVGAILSTSPPVVRARFPLPAAPST